MMMMNHKQRRWEAGPGPAGTAGPMVSIVNTSCKFFSCFSSIVHLLIMC